MVSRTSPWDVVASALTGRRSWLALVALLVLSGALFGFVGENESAGQSPNSVPAAADSAAVDDLLAQFPNSDVTQAILVVTRNDGGELSNADIQSATTARDNMRAVGRSVDPAADAPVPLTIAPDKKAAIGIVPVDSTLSGFALNDLVTELRTAATRNSPPDLRVQVTGGPAFGADIANSFSGANTTLLAVTGLVVALLLIATYRSPILWLVPLAVVGVADRVATTVGIGLAELTGLSFDGSTSGITSVLVFGAGTNYALLLVSRYREELGHEDDHRVALRRAVRHAGPAILASNATVVLALLVLLLGTLPSTRSLGALAAAGLVVAVVFVLVGLPPALALCGKRLFWPFVPHVGDRDTTTDGPWFRVASAVARQPARVAAAALVALAICAAGLFGTDVGLSQTEQFRVAAESVDGFTELSAHFPAGQSDPTIVVAQTPTADEVQKALDGTDGVVSASQVARSDTGLSRWSVVTDAAPGSDDAFAVIESTRSALSPILDADALVGGSDAQALDTRNAAARDRILLIPLILAVVLAVLVLLLRAAAAPVVLVATTVLSALAALGIGSWVSLHIFGFPALDTNVPLFAFLFLVALGVDYTIFLVTRAREETPEHGTRDGIVRAVAATGGVITSAGIVLAAVFCVLGVLPLITLTQLGIVVGLGILLDTFVVRTLVIPALFTLIGPRIWWPNPIDSSVHPRKGAK
ncbi:MMPL family transporter [Antrihabitans sp. YC2-6]|uniref:MMPL family transporter n=1 Tax=Antrihabitans sp. YC2-6 TaxID=2799498 RepID=UPI0018F58B38|nr:MMPL family transporter [Antrihabitans sp. YC2-6]MBJ8343863.1 MMPL family transporter [Antrihabitans sp. YC2-6]